MFKKYKSKKINQLNKKVKNINNQIDDTKDIVNKLEEKIDMLEEEDPLVLYYCLSLPKYADQSIHISTGVSYNYVMTNNDDDINIVSNRTITNEEGNTIYHDTGIPKAQMILYGFRYATQENELNKKKGLEPLYEEKYLISFLDKNGSTTGAIGGNSIYENPGETTITTVPKSIFSVNSAWGTYGNVDLSKYKDSYSEWYYYNDDWPSLRKILHFRKNEKLC
jgi:hypothetical protein